MPLTGCRDSPAALGDNSERVPPVPIPNTEVKPLSPDGTARASVWESRKSPKLILKAPISDRGFFACQARKRSRVQVVSHFTRDVFSAVIAILGIAASLLMRYGLGIVDGNANWPLLGALVLGGSPQVATVWRRVLTGRMDADILAMVSIVTSLILREYLAGTIIVLMLAGGGDESEFGDLGDLIAVALKAAKWRDIFARSIGPHGDSFQLNLFA